FLNVTDAIGDNKTRDSRFFRWLDRWYTGWVRWALANPYAIIGIALLVFALTFPLNWMVGRSFIPNEDMSEFVVHMDGPAGSAREGMAELTKKVASELRPIEGVKHIEMWSGASGRVNHGHLLVQLLPPEDRKLTQDQIIQRFRRVLATHPANRPSITMRTA